MTELILLITIVAQSGIAMQSYAREHRHMAAIHMNKECTPFEAQYESLKKLSFGNVSQTTGMLYRDSKCRQRIEDRVEAAPGEIVTFVEIDDPVDHTSHVLCVESKAILSKQILHAEGFSVWIFDPGGGQGIGLPLVPPERPPDFEPKQIEGFTCHGYRLRQSQEYPVAYWYSVDLNQLMLVTMPSEKGEFTWRLFNIRLTEPNERLFTVPADYKPAHREG